MKSKPTYDDVLDAALDLSCEEREELIVMLKDWRGIERGPDGSLPPVSKEWLREIKRRSDEYDAGVAKTYPWDETKKRARRSCGLSE